MKPCKCGKPSDGWPGKDGGELCQLCWEAECSETWWAWWIAAYGHVEALEAACESMRKLVESMGETKGVQ